MEKQRGEGKDYEDCGRDLDLCCRETFEIKFIEAVYINNKLNKMLSSSERLEIIARAAGLANAPLNIGHCGAGFTECQLILRIMA
ncbi:MAG: hypothetical protein ACUVQ6_08605 [Dissulfurimicrobium sp.]|uniref:hypothetical protein n=1 Tax=Dissulfurimicrobium sp. TaxID=2022436 RepID=UPI00404A8FA9